MEIVFLAEKGFRETRTEIMDGCQWQTLNPPDPRYEAYGYSDKLRFWDPLHDLPRRPLAERYASFRARLDKRLAGTTPAGEK